MTDLRIRKRSDWEPRGVQRDTDFHRRPPGMPDGVKRLAWHYTGAPRPLHMRTESDVVSFMQRTHYSYLRNKTGGGYTSLVTGEEFPGFPLGYSFIVDPVTPGQVWESAGLDYRPAATGGHNNSTIAVLFPLGVGEAVPAHMLATARALHRWINEHIGTLDEPWAHGWFRERLGTGTATACCGDLLKAELLAGNGDPTLDAPTPAPEPGPTPTPDPPEDDDMKPRYLTFHDDPMQPVFPTPVFECIGMTCTHVNARRWALISKLDDVKLENAGPDAAAYRTLVGGIDDAGDWSHITDMFGQRTR